MSKFYWCSICERTFNIYNKYNNSEVRIGIRGGYYCPYCGASPMETLDWESFIFGPASSNNYPEQPSDGYYYPLYPTL
jgi:hypothetical protein